MFTFGIFTTHTPYFVLVAFYAYFLLFGVNKATDGKIKFAESSIAVKMHIDNSVEHSATSTQCFYYDMAEIAESEILARIKTKQKLKHLGLDKIFPQDLHKEALFGRPPPAWA